MSGSETFLVDEAATEAFGHVLAIASEGRGVISLSGDLGTGKTTLSRGLIRALGHTGAVKSPTFTIVEPYELSDKTIMHFDLYRLEDPEELEFLGYRDYLNDDTLCLIEWPEKAAGYLPPADLQIILKVKRFGRIINWSSNTDNGARMVEKISEILAKNDVPSANIL